MNTTPYKAKVQKISLFALALILIALTLNGCMPLKPKITSETRQALQNAQILVREGDFAKAEQIYLKLARSNQSPHREHFQLLAAQAMLDQGNDAGVEQVISKLNPKKLTKLDLYLRTLLSAQLELNRGHPQPALDKLQSILPKQLPEERQRAYYQIRAEAYAELKQPLSSARERVKLAELIPDSETGTIELNTMAILAQLSLLPDATLSRRDPAPDILSGWMALTEIVKNSPPNSTEFNSRINRWQTAYPNNLIRSNQLKPLLHKVRYLSQPPKSIAVLLPLSGSYASYGEAIRDGIQSAHQRGSNRPTLQFYDTERGNPYQLYQNAVKAGADFVIGPLLKNNLRRIISAGKLTAPILALLQLPDQNQHLLFQFGLNPEDEARQAAKNAYSDGHKKALVLVPQSELGQRLDRAFSSEWQQLGGDLVASQGYPAKSSDLTAEVKSLLKYRPDPSGTAIIRSDADFIFLVAHFNQGRIIRPLLQELQAGALPIYSTALIYGGKPDPTEDRSLDGITFCDIPFLFNDQRMASGSDAYTDPQWNNVPGPYLRLIALGIDSYRLAMAVSKMAKSPNKRLSGATGDLTIDKKGYIHRQLLCPQFRDGRPQLGG